MKNISLDNVIKNWDQGSILRDKMKLHAAGLIFALSSLALAIITVLATLFSPDQQFQEWQELAIPMIIISVGYLPFAIWYYIFYRRKTRLCPDKYNLEIDVKGGDKERAIVLILPNGQNFAISIKEFFEKWKKLGLPGKPISQKISYQSPGQVSFSFPLDALDDKNKKEQKENGRGKVYFSGKVFIKPNNKPIKFVEFCRSQKRSTDDSGIDQELFLKRVKEIIAMEIINWCKSASDKDVERKLREIAEAKRWGELEMEEIALEVVPLGISLNTVLVWEVKKVVVHKISDMRPKSRRDSLYRKKHSDKNVEILVE